MRKTTANASAGRTITFKTRVNKSPGLETIYEVFASCETQDKHFSMTGGGWVNKSKPSEAEPWFEVPEAQAPAFFAMVQDFVPIEFKRKPNAIHINPDTISMKTHVEVRTAEDWIFVWGEDRDKVRHYLDGDGWHPIVSGEPAIPLFRFDCFEGNDRWWRMFEDLVPEKMRSTNIALQKRITELETLVEKQRQDISNLQCQVSEGKDLLLAAGNDHIATLKRYQVPFGSLSGPDLSKRVEEIADAVTRVNDPDYHVRDASRYLNDFRRKAEKDALSGPPFGETHAYLNSPESLGNQILEGIDDFENNFGSEKLHLIVQSRGDMEGISHNSLHYAAKRFWAELEDEKVEGDLVVTIQKRFVPLIGDRLPAGGSFIPVDADEATRLAGIKMMTFDEYMAGFPTQTPRNNYDDIPDTPTAMDFTPWLVGINRDGSVYMRQMGETDEPTQADKAATEVCREAAAEGTWPGIPDAQPISDTRCPLPVGTAPKHERYTVLKDLIQKLRRNPTESEIMAEIAQRRIMETPQPDKELGS